MERTRFPLPELNLTRSQIKAILAKIASKPDGYNELLRLMIKTIMESEQQFYKEETGDVGNGYRPRRIIYDRLVLSLQVPRTRSTNFYPMILAILSQWKEEAKQVAFKLYSMDLTTEQIVAIFEILYGRSYSKSQISKIFSGARQIVKQWLYSPLNWYYPIRSLDSIKFCVYAGAKVY